MVFVVVLEVVAFAVVPVLVKSLVLVRGGATNETFGTEPARQCLLGTSPCVRETRRMTPS